MQFLALRHYRFAKFLIVGVSNTAISYTVFIILLGALNTAYKAGMAQAGGYAAGILWSYVWNRLWTFQSTAQIVKESITFIISQLALLALSSLLLYILVDLKKYPASIMWLCVMVAITAINYMVQKHLVYEK